MELHITDPRLQTNLSEKRAAFQKGLASELSPDASAMVATWNNNGNRGNCKGEYGKVQQGAVNARPRLEKERETELLKVPFFHAGITIATHTITPSHVLLVKMASFRILRFPLMIAAQPLCNLLLRAKVIQQTAICQLQVA